MRVHRSTWRFASPRIAIIDDRITGFPHGRYLASRLLSVIPTLFVVSVVVFGLQQMLPGDAATALAGDEMNPQVIAQIRSAYHLDQPIIVQYGLWLGNLLHGDLGQSLRNHVAVRN